MMFVGSTHPTRRVLRGAVIATLALVFAASAALAQSPPYGVPESGPPGQSNAPAPPLASQLSADALDQLMEWERQDMGAPPTRNLHTGSMHSATPNQIPGGQVITTKELVQLLQNGPGAGTVVLDILGSSRRLPNAIFAAQASHAGSFDDPIQQQFGQMLQRATHGNHDAPLVLYCQGPQCWNSYNASLRAISLGYRNVLWYRGGLEAWQRAGLPLSAAP